MRSADSRGRVSRITVKQQFSTWPYLKASGKTSETHPDSKLLTQVRGDLVMAVFKNFPDDCNT